MPCISLLPRAHTPLPDMCGAGVHDQPIPRGSLVTRGPHRIPVVPRLGEGLCIWGQPLLADGAHSPELIEKS